MTTIEFVSYGGCYPNLCSGELIIKINSSEVNLGRCLVSGGSVFFDENWSEGVTAGEWTIGDLPDAYEQYRAEITNLVNQNVPHGCCGGCV
jgi:hypothetical protein